MYYLKRVSTDEEIFESQGKINNRIREFFLVQQICIDIFPTL